jgi:predicted nucleic acid-binding protein
LSRSVRYHLDTDFLIYATSVRGAERRRFLEIVKSAAELEISSIAWYEFCRGPRTPEQIAVARDLFGAEGIIAFTDTLAELAAEQFRKLGSPRRRAADVAIGVVAVSRDATLVARNARDFAGIESLEVDTVG